MDGQLPMSKKRRIDLHLRRCARCREFCESERREHTAWFRALNDVSDIPQMSPDVEARFLSSIKPLKARPFGQLFKWFRRAAVLLILAGGASYAAWIGNKANEATAVTTEVPAKTVAMRSTVPYSYIQDGWPMESEACSSASSEPINIDVGARSTPVHVADTGTLEARYRSICCSEGSMLNCSELHGTTILFR
jgi:hypothetical protein